ncbi:hypothetical protein HYR99_17625 [Candidatus Poribacteria bacterium]|nr:hypothetical protein [Candidatus Poribacteria bacterium]
MITLPASYSDTHQHVTLKYLVEGRQALSSAEWKTALSGFDMLHQAVVETETENLTFREVYQRYVDGSFADPYITELLRLRDVAQEHQAVRARFARAIVRRLTETGLRHPEVRETNLLLAYCLYFWESFAAGYAFEVEIFRNLSASGIRFKAHDLRDRRTRISPYDLEILGLRGDVKTSFYFLYVGRGQGLPNDFYITRFYEANRQRTLVVMLQLAAWEQIDGETITSLLAEATRHFPQPVRIELELGSVIIADYNLWKQKVLQKQREMEDANGE